MKPMNIKSQISIELQNPPEPPLVPACPRVKDNLEQPVTININTSRTVSRKNQLINVPLEPAPMSLLITNAEFADARARILIDPGAELNHISIDYCKRHKISTKQELVTASMANGTEENMNYTLHPVTISVGGYTEKMRLAANKQTYDLILGKSGVMITKQYWIVTRIK